MKITPLSAVLGAEVTDIDLAADLDETSFAAIKAAHLEHLVLVFRDQDLSPDEQIAFSKRFGPLGQHPADDAVLAGYPDILVVSTRKEDGKYVGLPDGGPKWHSDLAYKSETSLGSLLYGIEIPAEGGNTGFANMYAAYDALPEHLKTLLRGKTGVFLAGRNQNMKNFRRALNERQTAATPAVHHPIVRVHPETGRKSIFANEQHTMCIDGLPDDESQDVLQQIFAHCAKPEFVYSHRWRQGDLVFWDNRCVLHIADHSRLDDPSYIRHMHRTTVLGGRPVGEEAAAI